MFSRLSHYKYYIRIGVIAGGLISAALLFGFVLSDAPPKATASGERDCDPTSVIWCGTLTVDELITQYSAGGTAPHHYGDISAIYNYFGISSANVMGLKTKVGHGTVRADGTVWLDGKQIGSGAMTAGRVKTANSVAIPGTSAYKRPPSDSFARPATVIDAFIGYDSAGQPAWAILKSCGNPVSFTKLTPPPPPPQPKPKPSLVLTKQVLDPVSGQYVKEATLKNDSVVTYKIVVSNNGQGEDTSVRLNDVLPSNQTYVAGSTTVNGSGVADGITAGGISLGTLPASQKSNVVIKARVKVPVEPCGTATMINTAKLTSTNTPGLSDSATTRVTVNCIKAACTSLSISPSSVQLGQSVTVTAQAQTENTTVVKYEFSVNGKVVQSGSQNSYTFTPSAAGSYTISALITFANGTTSGGSNSNCVAVLSVGTPPKPPCTVPGKENLPADSPDCVLVDTGPVGMIGLFLGTSSVTGAGYYFFGRRKIL